MDRKLDYEAPEAECMVVTTERRFLIESPTDFEEPATMTTVKDNIWGWM